MELLGNFILAVVIYIFIGIIASYISWRTDFAEEEEYGYVVLLWPILIVILIVLMIGDLFKELPRFFTWVTNQVSRLFIWLKNKEEKDVTG